MPVTPTSGFQLQALPQPLSIPTNIGRIDVPELQQAFRGGLQNVQAARLVGPQTRAAVAAADYQTQAAMEGLKRLPAETQQLLASYGAKAAEAENARQSALGAAPYARGIAESLAKGATKRAEATAGTGFGTIDTAFGPMVYTETADKGPQPIISPAATLGYARDVAARTAIGENVTILNPNVEQAGGERMDEVEITIFNRYGQPIQKKKALVPTGSRQPGNYSYSQEQQFNVDNLQGPLSGFYAPAPQAIAQPVPLVQTPVAGAPLAAAAPPVVPVTPAQPLAAVAAPADAMATVPPAVPQAAAPAQAAPATTPAAAPVAPTAPAVSQQAEKEAVPSVIDKNIMLTPKDGPIYDFSKRIMERAPKQPGAANQAQQAQRDKMGAEALEGIEALKTQKTAIEKFKIAFDEARKRGLPPGWQQNLVPTLLQQAFGFPEGQNLEAASNALLNEFSNTFTKFRAYAAVTNLLQPAKPQITDDETTLINKLNYYEYLNQRAQTQLQAMVGATQYQIPAATIRAEYNAAFNPKSVNDYSDWEKREGLMKPEQVKSVLEQQEAWLKDPKNLKDPRYEENRRKFTDATGIHISIAQ